MANEYLTTTTTIEVLGSPPSNAVVTTHAVEVLVSVNAPAPSSFIEIRDGTLITGGVTITG